MTLQSFRRPLASVSVGVMLCAGLASAGLTSASAADEGSAPTASADAPEAPAVPVLDRTAHRVGCQRAASVLGVTVHDGQRVTGAKVRILGPRTAGKKTVYDRELETSGRMRTNVMGGFSFSVTCLPATFIVEVSGGRIGTSKNTEFMAAIGSRSEKSVVVTPATTLAAEYLRHRPGLTPRQAVRHVSNHLDVAPWGSQVSHLGLLTSNTSATFHAGDFFRAAKRAGGVKAFAQAEATRITVSSKNSFAPENYQPATRPEYPDHDRNRVTSRTRSPRSNPIVSILTSVAGKALYSAACASLPPNPVTNLACANPQSTFDQAVTNQLFGITNQLNVLNSTVSDMQSTLTQMQQAEVAIEASIAELSQQGSQESYVSDATAAQQAYATAYDNSGIAKVQALVQEAYEDLFILSAVTPTTSTWTPTSDPEPTNSQVCGTMYTSSATSSGDNALSICLNLLEQTDAFVDPSNAYYNSLFEALVGGPGVPQDDLLIYTYQQMLTMGGHLPLSSAALAGIQSTFAQMGSLVDSAYALAGSAQMFRESATSGQQPSCPDLTTSGTWPASTAINVADACRILQSGLFVGAVQNAVAADIVVPPAGTLADPSSNYVWWGYPVDLSMTTMSNPSFPLYPGPSTSTYTATPIPLMSYAPMQQIMAASPHQLLTNEPAYEFALAGEADNLTLVGDILLAEPTVAQTLTAQGFTGIGSRSGGMTWANLGADPNVYATISTTNLWQSSQKMPSTTLGCTGFPASITNVFQCSSTGYSFASPSPKTLYGESLLEAVFASSSWNLTTGTVPTSTNAAACTTIGSDWLTGINPLNACWTDTFGLLVDKAAATGAAGSNFWTPAMLQGVPSGGVAPIPVPNAPVTAS